MDVNECEQDVCGDRGECVNAFGSFSCNCSEGYEGQFCDDQTLGDDTQVVLMTLKVGPDEKYSEKIQLVFN